MLYRARIKLFLILFSLVSAQSIAQSRWVPAGIDNFYDPGNETLTLSNVYILPDLAQGVEARYIFDTTFKYLGDSVFELIDSEELNPELECTVEEVLAAIPQLNLNLSIADANELIGCTADTRRWQADLEKGLLVSASWFGADGVPNTGFSSSFFNPFIMSSERVPSLSLSAFFGLSGTSTGGLITNANGPFISFTLRENVVESYSYKTDGQTNGQPREVCSSEMRNGFNQLEIGDSYQDIATKLNCDGKADIVTVSSEGEQHTYEWIFQSESQSIGIGGGIVRQLSQGVSATLLDGNAQSFVFNSTTNNTISEDCEVQDIVGAAEQFRIGDTISYETDSFSCGRWTESLRSDGSSTTITIRWRTMIAPSSPYTSENRSLFIGATDGIITSVDLQRF